MSWTTLRHGSAAGTWPPPHEADGASHAVRREPSRVAPRTTSVAGTDEEDVARPVPRLRRGHGDDAGEARPRAHESLVLPDPVGRRGPQVEGPGQVGRVPRGATVGRAGEPDVCRECSVAGRVPPQVVPEQA